METYPRYLIVHACEAKVDPICYSSPCDQEDTCDCNIRSSLFVFRTHFSLIGRDGAGDELDRKVNKVLKDGGYTRHDIRTPIPIPCQVVSTSKCSRISKIAHAKNTANNHVRNRPSGCLKTASNNNKTISQKDALASTKRHANNSDCERADCSGKSVC
jgi:hypothetical protein